MAFSKSLQKGQIPLDCELCDGRNKIQFKCLDCDLLMCSRCKEKVHARFKNATEHRIKDIKELAQQEEVDTFNFSDIKCADHSYQACWVYCKTCKKVICVKCITKVHNGHTFIDEEELDEQKKVVLRGQKKAERHINELSSSSFQLKDIKEQEDAKFKKVKQDILTHREALKREVDKYADNILKDLEKTWKSNSSVMGAERSKIDKTLANLQTASKTIKSTITSKDFVKFFEDLGQLAISLRNNEPLSKLEFSCLGRFMPGKNTQLNFGSVEDGRTLEVQPPKFELKVDQQFTTKLKNVHFVSRCLDGSLWIADVISKKVQLIKFDKISIKIMLELDIHIHGMEVMNASNNLLIIAGTRLQIINSTTGQITDSIYDTSQVNLQCVHITIDNKVIVGVYVKGEIYLTTAVIVMGQDGRCLAKYKEDSDKRSLFSSPTLITSTKNGNIFVMDMDIDDYEFRRVVVLGKEGGIKQVITGDSIINYEENILLPYALVTTPADNIVITGLFTSSLHVLNCEGTFVGCYTLYDMGIIINPCSIAFSSEGHMYIGCSDLRESPETLKGAKLYEFEYSGF